MYDVYTYINKMLVAWFSHGLPVAGVGDKGQEHHAEANEFADFDGGAHHTVLPPGCSQIGMKIKTYQKPCQKPI